MAELSYYWDGTTVGDASLATYDDTEMAANLHDILGASFVVPKYLNELAPSTDDAGDIYIDTGGAYVYGYLFTSDFIYTPTFDAQGGGVHRIDRVVLRRDAAAQTVRFAIIKGVAGAVPAIPALTANDLGICWVYLINGFGGGSTIDAIDTHDDRKFAQFGVHPKRFDEKNILQNSEFMAFSRGDLTTSTPEYWSGAPASCTSAAAFPDQPRGQAIDVALNVGATYLRMDTIQPPLDNSVLENEPFIYFTGTFKTQLNVKTGNVRMIISGQRLAAYGGALVTILVDRLFQVTSGVIDIEEHFRYDASIFGTLVNNQFTFLRINFAAYDTNTTFELGGVILTKGYVPGPFRQVRETILFKAACPDPTWVAYSPGAASITAVPLGTAGGFNGDILDGTRNVLLKVYALDAGSAAAASYAYINTHHLSPVIFPAFTGDPAYLYNELQGVTNSQPREVRGWVSVYYGANAQFTVTALTAAIDITLTIMGIQT